MSADRFVQPDALASYGIPWGPRWLLELEKAGKFPRRCRVSHNRVVWSEREILDYIEAQKAARPTHPKTA